MARGKGRSFSVATGLLPLLCWTACALAGSEGKSIFGIGNRVEGDKLIMRDVLRTPQITLTEEPSIQFSYAISQPITYIEILSQMDIYATVEFSYEDDLIRGTVRERGHFHKIFEVLIQIYGFNETAMNLDPSHILNKHEEFNGVLRPGNRQYLESMRLTEEDSVALENFDLKDDEDYKENAFSASNDKLIELGKRQAGDYLIYELEQTSPNSTTSATKHDVVFYFTDNVFLTYLQFTIYEHFLEKPPHGYRPPTVQLERITPHSFKATVTDQHTRNLFVRMQVYGYKPSDKPVAFVPISSQGDQQQVNGQEQLPSLPAGILVSLALVVTGARIRMG